MDEWERLQAIVAAVQARTVTVPQVAILLGTGLGGLATRLEAEVTIPYDELPGMPVAGVEGHAGELVIGSLGGVPVVAFSGRAHCYEGVDVRDVVVPVRVAKLLGATALVMGSASGGMDPDYEIGDLVVLADHINFMGVNPLVGPNDDRIGPRWPDMFDTYDAGLRDLARAEALRQGKRLHVGTYVGVLGPNLETRAEYRMLRAWGGDVVGMSTVPEAIAAVHCGLRTLAFAVATDLCLPDALEPADVAKIIAAANAAEPVLSELVASLLPQIAAAGGKE